LIALGQESMAKQLNQGTKTPWFLITIVKKYPTWQFRIGGGPSPHCLSKWVIHF
jgi:hypothetical protein